MTDKEREFIIEKKEKAKRNGDIASIFIVIGVSAFIIGGISGVLEFSSFGLPFSSSLQMQISGVVISLVSELKKLGYMDEEKDFNKFLNGLENEQQEQGGKSR